MFKTFAFHVKPLLSRAIPLNWERSQQAECRELELSGGLSDLGDKIPSLG